MYKIMFISQDPGGTNVLIPVIKEMDGKCNIVVIAKDNAIDIYKSRGIPCINADKLTNQFDKDSLINILKKYNPDLIATGTGSADFFERKMWVAARELCIESMAILDSWSYYGLRFSDYTFKEIALYKPGNLPYLPDHILVMDDDAKKGMMREGISENRIEVVGQPFLQGLKRVFENVKQSEIEAYRKKICGNKEKKIIVYCSDNLSDSFYPDGKTYWGYDEKSTFIEVYNSIKKKCRDFDSYLLLIRPHPKEKCDNWDNIISKIKAEGQCNITVDRNTKEELIISSADIVIGMWTMLLVEAALAGKKILSIQINAKRRAPFILQEKGLVKPIFQREELEQMLELYFSDQPIKNVIWDVGNDSVTRIRSYIFDLLSKNSNNR